MCYRSAIEGERGFVNGELNFDLSEDYFYSIHATGVEILSITQ